MVIGLLYRWGEGNVVVDGYRFKYEVSIYGVIVVFFFQAEDGIRDRDG